MNTVRNRTVGRVGLLLILLMVMLSASPTIHVPVSAQEPNPSGKIYLPLAVNQQSASDLRSISMSLPVSLKLPWDKSEAWTYNQGPHGRADGIHGKVCEYSTPKSALDFGVPEPSNLSKKHNVLAAAGGTVKFAALGSAGKTIIIEHASGFYTLYGHLHQDADGIQVKIGDVVLQGQTIGVAGCTGDCGGVHLHFELLSSYSPEIPRNIIVSPKQIDFSMG